MLKIVVLDTETTGLYNKKEQDLDKQPHIIQFAALFWDIFEDWQFSLSWTTDLLFKPPIPIPYETSQIHHIYDIDVKDKNPIDEDLYIIIQKLNECDIIIWHNIEFDINMLKVEVSRLKKKNILIDFQPKKVFCTMNESINWCKLPKKSWKGYKRPKLQELCKKALWDYFSGAHNALVDIEYTLRAFLSLYEKWIFKLEERQQQWLFD